MPRGERPTTISGVVDLLEDMQDDLRALGAGLSRNDRLRNVALLTAFLCLLAAGFSAGYAVKSREQLNIARNQLGDQIATNRVAVCASARSTAVAFREPQISSHGTPEPADHFIERMLAQREILRAAKFCSDLPGFATFPFLRARGLHEIEEVLHRANPHRFKSAKPLPSVTSAPSASSGEATGTAPQHGSHLAGPPPPNPPAQPGHHGTTTPPAHPKGEKEVPESGAPAPQGGDTGPNEGAGTPSTPGEKQEPPPSVLESIGGSVSEALCTAGRIVAGVCVTP